MSDTVDGIYKACVTIRTLNDGNYGVYSSVMGNAGFASSTVWVGSKVAV